MFGYRKLLILLLAALLCFAGVLVSCDNTPPQEEPTEDPAPPVLDPSIPKLSEFSEEELYELFETYNITIPDKMPLWYVRALISSLEEDLNASLPVLGAITVSAEEEEKCYALLRNLVIEYYHLDES